jgi:hypothetical protein
MVGVDQYFVRQVDQRTRGQRRPRRLPTGHPSLSPNPPDLGEHFGHPLSPDAEWAETECGHTGGLVKSRRY